MSRTAAPMAEKRVDIPPLKPLSRWEVLAMMRDNHDATPIIKEWCGITRILVSMVDVLGEENNQNAMREIKDPLLADLDRVLQMVAYAKADPSFFEPPKEPLDFVLDVFPHVELEFEAKREALGESWLNNDPEMLPPTKEALELEELASA